ncbi:hypothetical protein EV200_103621 [Pedobacter psychrotolerans]|uniref:Uncharacterized protein n=1 Tax=Pedobacter psychrotolerans TaxID=1843235 RepID=A0A4R2HHS5_9SPHI|nr:hypothetical protein EV200_103621 [Pedobacter psychrotolerans]
MKKYSQIIGFIGIIILLMSFIMKREPVKVYLLVILQLRIIALKRIICRNVIH